ncbi:MAG: hypothetical protein WCL32_09665 [Planctomycetota bacterium]
MTALESRLAFSVKSAASVAAWVVVAVATLTGGSLAISWIVTVFRGGSPMRGENVLVGLVCCLIALLFVGVFHLRKETVQLRVSDREKFHTRIQRILEDLGYQFIQVANNEWRGRPHFRALLFGDGVTLKLEGNRVSLSGPRLSLELIRRRYRMASHLDKVQQSISDSRSRVAETYLKRLELSLRLEPEHMEGFQSKILEILAENGNVLVDVQLMLISEAGMKESLWTKEMRPWLEENHIHFEYHRDHTQRATIGAISGENRADSFIDTCVWS